MSKFNWIIAAILVWILFVIALIEADRNAPRRFIGSTYIQDGRTKLQGFNGELPESVYWRTLER